MIDNQANAAFSRVIFAEIITVIAALQAAAACFPFAELLDFLLEQLCIRAVIRTKLRKQLGEIIHGEQNRFLQILFRMVLIKQMEIAVAAVFDIGIRPFFPVSMRMNLV